MIELQPLVRGRTVERLEMYGEPDERVRAALPPGGTSVVPRLIGFLR